MAYGKVHIYTGDGKGKTSAAFGLGLRAAGCGAKVVCVQFLKTGETGEMEALRHIPNVSFYRFEQDHGFYWTMDEPQKRRLQEDVACAYAFCLAQLREAACDVLILDEILGVMQNGLLTQEQILALMRWQDSKTEVILTGRGAPQELIDCADYVTEMKQIRHPFEKGCKARRGIEY